MVTNPEDMTEAEQAYWEGRAEENARLQQRIEELEAILDGDPNQTETAETRRAWRHSAVKYADKCDKRIAELEAFIEQQSKRMVKLIKE